MNHATRPTTTEATTMTSSTDGPDQGDPAAWGIYRKADTDGSDELVEVTPEKPEAHDLSEDEHVRALYLRAPGAVAAAPPGDEEEVLRSPAEVQIEGGRVLTVTPPGRCNCTPECGWARVDFYDPASKGRERAMFRPSPIDARALAEALLPDSYSVVRHDAPPTGHEDEAAVERAARAICPVPWNSVPPVEQAQYLTDARAALAAARGLCPVENEAVIDQAANAARNAALGGDIPWGELFEATRDYWRRAARAALAAARGPRTPDGLSTNG